MDQRMVSVEPLWLHMACDSGVKWCWPTGFMGEGHVVTVSERSDFQVWTQTEGLLAEYRPTSRKSWPGCSVLAKHKLPLYSATTVSNATAVASNFLLRVGTGPRYVSDVAPVIAGRSGVGDFCQILTAGTDGDLYFHNLY